jgi:hypothetical protein
VGTTTSVFIGAETLPVPLLRPKIAPPPPKVDAMVRFEREVVEAMVDGDGAGSQGEIEAFVGRALGVMPAHLRLPILVYGVLLAAWETVNPRGLRRLRSPAARAARVGLWEGSKLGPTRQYGRMLRSLTLYAQNELVP